MSETCESFHDWGDGLVDHCELPAGHDGVHEAMGGKIVWAPVTASLPPTPPPGMAQQLREQQDAARIVCELCVKGDHSYHYTDSYSDGQCAGIFKATLRADCACTYQAYLAAPAEQDAARGLLSAEAVRHAVTMGYASSLGDHIAALEAKHAAEMAAKDAEIARLTDDIARLNLGPLEKVWLAQTPPEPCEVTDDGIEWPTFRQAVAATPLGGNIAKTMRHMCQHAVAASRPTLDGPSSVAASEDQA